MTHIAGIEGVVRNLSRYSDEAIKKCVQAAQISQALIVNDARASHPYTDRTTHLTQSIQPGEIQVTDKEITAYVEARMNYASFVEFGTSRSKPYPFLVPAVIRQSRNFRKAIAAEMKEIRL